MALIVVITLSSKYLPISGDCTASSSPVNSKSVVNDTLIGNLAARYDKIYISNPLLEHSEVLPVSVRLNDRAATSSGVASEYSENTRHKKTPSSLLFT